MFTTAVEKNLYCSDESFQRRRTIFLNEDLRELNHFNDIDELVCSYKYILGLRNKCFLLRPLNSETYVVKCICEEITSFWRRKIRPVGARIQGYLRACVRNSTEYTIINGCYCELQLVCFALNCSIVFIK